MALQKVEYLRRRWVYGTKTDKWYFVDETDRDYAFGITREEMAKIGPDAAKEKYLNPRIIDKPEA